MLKHILAALTITLAPTVAIAANATADMINTDGKSVGSATFTNTPNGVLIQATIEGIAPGSHGFHIHETGSCDPSTGFKSAGGHLAGGMKHGFLVEGGPHPGDMPNVHVGQDGVLKIEVYNNRVKLDSSSLLKENGTALVVHSGADDYKSQPSGDAGSRIACGVIAASQ